MDQIFLLIDGKFNRRLLKDYLKPHYEILEPASINEYESLLRRSFDLCIIDGLALNRLWEQIYFRKDEEQPVFLPVLLLTSRQKLEAIARYLRKSIDEFIATPVEKIILTARVEVLLRARRSSLDLKLRNDDLEAFILAMTHDLRAPVRIIDSFAQHLYDEQGKILDEQGRHYLRRIQAVSKDMLILINDLLDYVRIGRRETKFQFVQLQPIINGSLRDVGEDVKARNAHVGVVGGCPVIRADPALLRAAMTNLVSNALKFVSPGVKPQVAIVGFTKDKICRIEIHDNGIGISTEDQKRIFKPFVRLHGVEEYPGTGLGLATVRKVVELMGGRVGVISSPGKGSIFWIELSGGEKS